MARFLVTYHGGGAPDPSQMDEIRAAFGAWLGRAGSAVVDPGAPLRFVGQVASSEPAPSIAIGGYSVIEAADEAGVREILSTHPFVARGGTLQIDEAM